MERRRTVGSNRQAEIGEMMLAKTVLEEKNELLESRQRTIADLRGREKQLEQDIIELKSRLREARDRALQEGMEKVVADVVSLVDSYHDRESGVDGRLAGRLIRLFQERYGLETIEGTSGKVDPHLHEVIEVAECPGEDSFIQVRSRGFRVHGKLIRPALVKVFRGTKDRN